MAIFPQGGRLVPKKKDLRAVRYFRLEPVGWCDLSEPSSNPAKNSSTRAKPNHRKAAILPGWRPPDGESFLFGLHTETRLITAPPSAREWTNGLRQTVRILGGNAGAPKANSLKCFNAACLQRPTYGVIRKGKITRQNESAF
jgi:hypothetical protein